MNKACCSAPETGYHRTTACSRRQAHLVSTVGIAPDLSLRQGGGGVNLLTQTAAKCLKVAAQVIDLTSQRLPELSHLALVGLDLGVQALAPVRKLLQLWLSSGALQGPQTICRGSRDWRAAHEEPLA